MGEKYHSDPWFDSAVVGLKVKGERGQLLYTIRLYPPDAFAAVRLEVRGPANELLATKTISLFDTDHPD